MTELFDNVATIANNSQPDPLGIAMATFSIIGAIFLLVFSLPLFIATVRTRDTTNVSYSMWSIYVVATVLLATSSLVNSIQQLSGANVDENTKIGMIPLLIIGLANVISFFTAMTMIILKAINISKAKKAGLSEAEYCILHNPLLKKEAKAIEEIKNNEQELNQSIIEDKKDCIIENNNNNICECIEEDTEIKDTNI